MAQSRQRVDRSGAVAGVVGVDPPGWGRMDCPPPVNRLVPAAGRGVVRMVGGGTGGRGRRAPRLAAAAGLAPAAVRRYRPDHVPRPLGPGGLQRRQEGARVRTARAMDSAAGLLHRSRRRRRGHRRRRPGRDLSRRRGRSRLLRAAGAIRRRRREAAGDRLAGERQFDRRRLAAAVRPFLPPRAIAGRCAGVGRFLAGAGGR